MSGAATTAGVSKFQSFMNHPAGESFGARSVEGTVRTDGNRLLLFFRAQDGVLLGPSDEMVSGSSGS